MQSYLDGYKPGDPLIEDPHPSVPERSASLSDQTLPAGGL
jgi:phenol 2-monooxygenase